MAGTEKWLDNLKPESLDRFAGQRQHRRLPLYGHLLDQQRQRRGIDRLQRQGFREHHLGDQLQLQRRRGVQLPPGPRIRRHRVLPPQDDRHAAGIPRAAFEGLLLLLRQRGRHAQQRYRDRTELYADPPRKPRLGHQPQHDAPAQQDHHAAARTPQQAGRGVLRLRQRHELLRRRTSHVHLLHEEVRRRLGGRQIHVVHGRDRRQGQPHGQARHDHRVRQGVGLPLRRPHSRPLRRLRHELPATAAST